MWKKCNSPGEFPGLVVFLAVLFLTKNRAKFNRLTKIIIFPPNIFWTLLKALSLSTKGKAKETEITALNAYGELQHVLKSEHTPPVSEYIRKTMKENKENWGDYENILTKQDDAELLVRSLLDAENLCTRDVLIALKVAKELSAKRVEKYDGHIGHITRDNEKRNEKSAKWNRMIVDPDDVATLMLAEIVGIEG